MVKNNKMGEEEIKLLIRKEIASCFDQLTKDVTQLRESNRKLEKGIERIERVLVGDKDMSDIGYAEMIKYSYDYAKKNTESRIIDRGERAITHFDIWEKENKWQVIDDMIDKFKIVKWLTALIVGSGIISVANVISVIIDIFKLG